jgi:hypothetical protein
MDITRALPILDNAQVLDDDMERAQDSVAIEILAQLVAAQYRIKRMRKGGEPFSKNEPAAIWSGVRYLHKLADTIERDLIRELKGLDYDEVPEGGRRTWQHVADASEGLYNSRQAAQKRWKELDADTRRHELADRRFGAAVPRPKTAPELPEVPATS